MRRRAFRSLAYLAKMHQTLSMASSQRYKLFTHEWPDVQPTLLQIEHVYFSGHRKGDVAFFHSASRSLLVQDLLFNQPAKDEHNESVNIVINFGILALMPIW